MKYILKIMLSIYNKVIYYQYTRRMRDLMNRGLTIGKNVTIEHSVMIDTNYPYLIKIGSNCSLAQGVKLLAHDATPFKFLNGHTRLGKIEIKDNVFIGTEVIILPGVTIGPNVLIAAGSVVNKDIPPNSCVAGVPARFYRKFDEYLKEMKDQIKERPVFEFNELKFNLKHEIQIEEKIWNLVDNGNIFLKGFSGDYHYTLNKK